ncbi:MAG: hypothetical protein COZ70_10015 [Deltaproteobacteria bacterium CG_4_8_14_3_um_filter_51_11]|nr:long-chain-fatty-acid--CoA ligase [bacterium]PIP47323.1 MAG: hypothetical protein COX16_05035 [Deltaproteobacteria bacterium CG23_combo_of_CG06-09_8_20_14_all_51_20]PIX19222.1 MAG: hypothetical protein COZ70_10015 [Deltaproteobacteria bacterium CG_4_8_14_3_um_filter_51_11]PIY25632.1 MAG: hypothetical protein COZ11_04850 [Deltaproteobacteria bacterium CG_4_10_14_3_um_filter_51_14]PJB36808.1 MAG: hypothetical protein CO107_06750 [Deltaproteobacteria bacterium CG_4_9_14_3_um_filter_51_14]
MKGAVPMGVGDVLRRSALHFPERNALIFEGRATTYSQLDRRVNRLSNGLLARGLKKGDRVAAIFHNGPEFFELYFACAKSGGVFVPVNNLLKRRELAQILLYIRPRFLIFDPYFSELVEDVAPELPFLESKVCLGKDHHGFTSYEDLIGGASDREANVPISGDDLTSIFLTSGTTGRPKGVMRTHYHELVNMMSCALELGIRYEDRILMLFPFYHITFADHLRHVLMANTIIIRREGGFDPSAVLGLMADERITICQFVPTMINSLLQGGNPKEYDLSHLRMILYAASPMPVELLKKAMQTFDCSFAQMYGQTETGPATTCLRPEDHRLKGTEKEIARLASAGRALMDYEVRIVNEDGRDMDAGEVGEIVVRSDAMTMGYWELPDETARAIRDGWLHTGDFGRLDREGYVFIVDRKNDMIISGGKNIYPREIEEVIYTHEAVSEVVVIGVPDDYWGESVKAIVVLKPGRSATEEEIISLCKDNLAGYKKPKSVEFRSQLPRSATGKVLKRVIREDYWKGRERRV